MAKATFNKFGEKLALILVKRNDLQVDSDFAYVPNQAVLARCKAKSQAEVTKGTEFEIEDGFTLKPIINYETKEPLTTQDGTPLMQLSY